MAMVSNKERIAVINRIAELRLISVSELYLYSQMDEHNEKLAVDRIEHLIMTDVNTRTNELQCHVLDIASCATTVA